MRACNVFFRFFINVFLTGFMLTRKKEEECGGGKDSKDNQGGFHTQIFYHTLPKGELLVIIHLVRETLSQDD